MSLAAIVVTTTAATRDDAQKIANALLEQRLAACVQLSAIDSCYRWKGEIVREAEVLLTIKTRAALYPRVEAAIREIHPYETPEILALTVEAGSEDYLAWIEAETDKSHD